MIEPGDFDPLFNALGFGFPEDSEQIANFDKAFNRYEFKSSEINIDPAKIWNSLKASEPATNIDYHKRTVLAAEIVSKLKNDFSLGHLKLQKLIYLCQNAMNMKIHANFLQQAMGPYDPQLMRSIDKQFAQRKWFKFQKNDFPKYLPLEKAGEHKEWYKRYFGREADRVDFLIETFRNKKTAEVELVATIYACWDRLLRNERIANNSDLISSVYEWSKEKSKFSREEIENAIKWMIDHGIAPK